MISQRQVGVTLSTYMAKDDKPVIINIKNRRASHEYSFLAK